MIYERILAERKQLEEKLSSIEETLKKFPSGKIFCCRNGTRYKWYQSDGHNHTYIPKKNRVLAEQLAVKKYLSHLSQELLSEKKALDFYLRHHKTTPPYSEQMLSEHPEYQELLSPYFKPQSQELVDWMNSHYERNPHFPEHLTQPTSSGILVRSKSEALIDMLLFKNKIPFRYECALNLSGSVIYPDFTILHPHTRRLYYWEHFGRMDDINYSKNVCPKLNLYISHGIIPSINLITTFETRNNPLNPETLEKIIEHYFL